MSLTPKLLSLLGASMLFAFADVAPASADHKPCCYNYGRYYQASPRTCYRYGGRVVPYEYCYRGGYRDGYYDEGYDYDYDRSYRRRPGVTFEIGIGDIIFGFNDGYYDRHRRWHRWRNHNERDYFRRHYRHRWRDHRYGDYRDWRD